ncbi:putative Xaa-Pro aminopeptidase 3 [Trichoplax sp. H2]|nr:putative Xaa-Pro aminopeptidase 3 [Trichoplax sp. H2]|eukprot:RDD44374.1 putative Xaa-Pro aminopeptidase 3 [Trichoplax sp. H2]
MAVYQRKHISSILQTRPLQILHLLKNRSTTRTNLMLRKYKAIEADQTNSWTYPDMIPKNEVASTPEILTSEYRLRRNKLMLSVANATKDIGSKKYVAVIAANPVYYMAPDVPYPYRQNSDFLYLTGFQEPDAVLVLESTDLTCYKSILFVREKNPQQELWDGPRCGVENVSELFGIDEGCSINKLPEYLSAWHNCTFWVNNLSTKIQNLLHSFRREYFDLSSFIHSLRIIKSSSEIDLMKLSAITASRAMAETMKASNAGISEAFLHAYFEFECRKNGADALAYPPVVAGGRRANILHYTKNSQLIVDDELVLVDAGCDYRCYSSDISRTWPINGRFNRAQRQLYEAILDVQETCIKACKPGISLNDLYVIMQKQLESNVVGKFILLVI